MDVGSIPGQGTRIPHAMGQLNPCPITTESASRAHTPQQEKPPQEKPVQNKERAAPTLGNSRKAHVATKT